MRGKTTFQALARDSVEAYFHSLSVLRDDERSRLYSNSFKAQLGGYNAIEVFRQHAARADTEDPLSLVQYIDLKTYLVGDINTKVDRASMAHALEVREPLMDHPLVEWLATLPSSYKLHGGEGKWIFKRALEPHLPHEVLYRPKMGFAVPLARWFRGPLKERVSSAVLGERLAESGYFDPDRPAPTRRSASERDARPQRSAVVAADVRRLSPDGRVAGRPSQSEGECMSRDDVNVLTFTTLYPSSARPRYGVFIESRLQQLMQWGGVKATVVAPVPWFPFTDVRWGEYGRIARTPRREVRSGIEVSYPRYPELAADRLQAETPFDCQGGAVRH